MKMFLLWLLALAATFYSMPEITLLIFMIGIAYFFVWLLIGGPEQYQLQPGTWVKSVTQENGMTIVTITDGSNDSIQTYTSNKVQISGNIITIG